MRGRAWRGVFGVTGLAVALAVGAAAQDPLPLTGELLVNQTTAGVQSGPAVGMAANGTHVVLWTSEGQDGDGQAIVFRKFPGDGTAPFNEAVLNQDTAGDQFNSAIDMNEAGGWVGAWDSTASGQGLRGRRTNAGGTVLANEFPLMETPAIGAQFVAVARSENDSFVAVWQASSESRFRRFDDTGAAVSGDGTVAPTLGQTFRPRVAARSDGGFVVAFEAVDDDQNGVYFQRFGTLGLPIGDPVHVAQSEAGDQRDADLAILPGNGFVIVWNDSLQGLRARRFRLTGVPLGDEIAVAPAVSVARPSVAVSSAGGFVVAYQPGEVRAREFDRLGRPVGPSFQVNLTTDGLQAAPTVGAGLDRFVVAWHSANFDGDGLAVVRRLYQLSSIFVDTFDSGTLGAWSSTVP